MDKKLLPTILLSISLAGATNNVHAMCPGLYFGVMGGLASTSVDSSDNVRLLNPTRTVRVLNPTTNTRIVKVGHGTTIDGITVLDESSGEQKFAGRIYGGYQTNNYLGFEMGLTGLSTFNLLVGDLDRDEGLRPPIQKVNAFLGWFDFSAKLGFSFHRFGLFAKAGLAVTYLSFDVRQLVDFDDDDDNNIINGNIDNNDIIVVNPDNGNGGQGNCNGTNNCNGSGNDNSQDNTNNDNNGNAIIAFDNVESVTKTQTKIRPIVGLGASYDLSDNWMIDVSWNRLFVNGVVNHVDFWALGLSYHFVERYCGQFLCDD